MKTRTKAAILFLCFNAFCFPLFADDREDLTNALKEAIPRRSDGKMDIEEIGRLLDAGADPNGFYRKEYQESFLYHAAESGNVQLTKILLEHGADPNMGHTEGNWSRSPPIFYGNRQITALFIEHGARFDVFDTDSESKMSPLLYQVANNVSSALLILEWEQQHSPDFCAHYKNRKKYLTETLSRFLQKGKFSDRARNEIYVLVERLIDGGADPSAPMEGGFPLAYLAVVTYTDKYHFIIPLLIEKGAPIDAFNDDGQTALYCAVYNEDLVLSDFLLKKGADINQQNKFSKRTTTAGETALMTAESEEMMRFLLERGANPNLQDKDGKTALMMYHARTKEPLTKLLLKHGADPTIKDNEGRTVLFRWLSPLDGPMIDELISRGCKIDEPDNEGNTPLIYAARYKESRETVLILLEKGADPHYRNAKGRTALHACLLSIKEAWPWYKDDDLKRDMPVITALLEAGTSPADKDDDGDSPLATALRIAGMDRKLASIGKLVRQYADAEDIKVASAAVRKEKREETREMLSEDLPEILKAFAFPVILGSVSFLMREIAFKDNPSGNIMGPVNSALTLGGGGFLLGFLLGGTAGDGLGAIGTGFVGGLIVGIAGIIVGCLPPVSNAFANNRVLYYTPAVGSIIIAWHYFGY